MPRNPVFSNVGRIPRPLIVTYYVKCSPYLAILRRNAWSAHADKPVSVLKAPQRKPDASYIQLELYQAGVGDAYGPDVPYTGTAYKTYKAHKKFRAC